ncbi:MAG: hypothetical protein AB4352_28000 [Hormoscilla sp.]
MNWLSDRPIFNSLYTSITSATVGHAGIRARSLPDSYSKTGPMPLDNSLITGTAGITATVRRTGARAIARGTRISRRDDRETSLWVATRAIATVPPGLRSGCAAASNLTNRISH